jgi:hypothetical protein
MSPSYGKHEEALAPARIREAIDGRAILDLRPVVRHRE